MIERLPKNHFYFVAKGLIHRSLGQRPRSKMAIFIWLKAILTKGVQASEYDLRSKIEFLVSIPRAVP